MPTEMNAPYKQGAMQVGLVVAVQLPHVTLPKRPCWQCIQPRNRSTLPPKQAGGEHVLQLVAPATAV